MDVPGGSEVGGLYVFASFKVTLREQGVKRNGDPHSDIANVSQA